MLSCVFIYGEIYYNKLYYMILQNGRTHTY